MQLIVRLGLGNVVQINQRAAVTPTCTECASQLHPRRGRRFHAQVKWMPGSLAKELAESLSEQFRHKPTSGRTTNIHHAGKTDAATRERGALPEMSDPRASHRGPQRTPLQILFRQVCADQGSQAHGELSRAQFRAW